MTLVGEPADDNDMVRRVAAVLAEGGAIEANEYGTPVSVHVCATCGDRFTVCPPVTEASYGPNCMADTCPSYDPARDATIYFQPDDPDLMRALVPDWTHTVTGGPWPERHGLRCRIVPPLDSTYPWHGLGKREVVVLVEDDPHANETCLGVERDPRWSCVLDAADITENP